MSVRNGVRKEVILGIDPGYDRCGWALLAVLGKQLKAVDFGCVETDRSATKTERFRQIWQHIKELLAEYDVSVIAMEGLFFARNVNTALPVSEVRGILFALAIEHGIPVVEYPPTTIKVAVSGYGKATKKQVITLAAKQLRLEKIPKLDDTGDAIAVALTHAVSADTEKRL